MPEKLSFEKDAPLGEVPREELPSGGMHFGGSHFGGIHTGGLHTEGIHTEGLHTEALLSEALHSEGVHHEIYTPQVELPINEWVGDSGDGSTNRARTNRVDALEMIKTNEVTLLESLNDSTCNILKNRHVLRDQGGVWTSGRDRPNGIEATHDIIEKQDPDRDANNSIFNLYQRKYRGGELPSGVSSLQQMMERETHAEETLVLSKRDELEDTSCGGGERDEPINELYSWGNHNFFNRGMAPQGHIETAFCLGNSDTNCFARATGGEGLHGAEGLYGGEGLYDGEGFHRGEGLYGGEGLHRGEDLYGGDTPPGEYPLRGASPMGLPNKGEDATLNHMHKRGCSFDISERSPPDGSPPDRPHSDKSPPDAYDRSGYHYIGGGAPHVKSPLLKERTHYYGVKFDGEDEDETGTVPKGGCCPPVKNKCSGCTGCTGCSGCSSSGALPGDFSQEGCESEKPFVLNHLSMGGSYKGETLLLGSRALQMASTDGASTKNTFDFVPLENIHVNDTNVFRRKQEGVTISLKGDLNGEKSHVGELMRLRTIGSSQNERLNRLCIGNQLGIRLDEGEVSTGEQTFCRLKTDRGSNECSYRESKRLSQNAEEKVNMQICDLLGCTSRVSAFYGGDEQTGGGDPRGGDSRVGDFRVEDFRVEDFRVEPPRVETPQQMMDPLSFIRGTKHAGRLPPTDTYHLNDFIIWDSPYLIGNKLEATVGKRSTFPSIVTPVVPCRDGHQPRVVSSNTYQSPSKCTDLPFDQKISNTHMGRDISGGNRMERVPYAQFGSCTEEGGRGGVKDPFLYSSRGDNPWAFQRKKDIFSHNRGEVNKKELTYTQKLFASPYHESSRGEGYRDGNYREGTYREGAHLEGTHLEGTHRDGRQRMLTRRTDTHDLW
ncbi:hypothetical protein PCYB_062110 [Plasmodium cynomolgi strain B]|uniref:Uncharacterized protein n=1 Tax=Plasmodium cynomolgi (strain B) TaxID=1120755 RepID=K6UR37_PLACD|nr:hypothetical protein PCYB_062110 [Plasmodium cynomolgi strain B]GAB65479.1 hypothetical protein PCYB_062110 [Plasmodium cynomolgi strain B]